MEDFFDEVRLGLRFKVEGLKVGDFYYYVNYRSPTLVGLSLPSPRI